MRFIHIADCHVGGWRDEKMKTLSTQSFKDVIETTIRKNADFLLISGDLFNTSHPAIDALKTVVISLKKLRDKKIGVYVTPGSHDFSPSGKTIIDVLEEAGLLVNVVKAEIEDEKLRLSYTVDEKTGAKITGMLGRRGSLESKYYEDLDRKKLEAEEGFKIFLFHSSIEELKPKSLEKMSAEPVSMLPKGFDYYAGGHIHITEKRSFENHKNVVYPGPTYPNNFKELEELESGSYAFYEDGDVSVKKIPSKKVIKILVDAKNKEAKSVEEQAINELGKQDLEDTIVLIRFTGRMIHSKTSDINFNNITRKAQEKKAFFVMRNTYNLRGEEFEEIKIEENTIEEIEEKLIDEHITSFKKEKVWIEKDLLKKLLNVLSEEKKEGETNTDYEERIQKEISQTIQI
ncbi:DNA repair exonuclease [Candidatus Woesearchaeota archaeon]|nr:DNA repair exonuclease [Candidatus Woesearchaeota archaeon]